jgi:arylsulfatase A-like enzyme
MKTNSRTSTKTNAKNIVLLITDTFRYDNLGGRAKRPVRTPELDRFAAERATSVEGCYMGSFPTIPHRTDLTSGVLGWPHYGWQAIELSGPNHLPSMLREAGYASQLICDCPHLFNAHFNAAFDAAYQHRGQEGDRPLLHLNDPIERVVPLEKTRTRPSYRDSTLVDMHRWTSWGNRWEAGTHSAKTAATTVRWLEDNHRAGPFFLWVDFFDPHEPWDPPEYLVRRYDPGYLGTPMLHPNYGPSSAYNPEELRNLWAHYAAESELVDRGIGRILQKMDDLELWEDTVVLITADHGTSLGEHERTGKSNIHHADPRYWPIYPEIGRVPCLLAGGGVPAGRSLDLLVQPTDLAPTLCELAGVQVKPPRPFDGSSFAGAVLAGSGAHRDMAVSGCFLAPEGASVPRKATVPFVVADGWGYAPVGAEGGPELYELESDPLAERNVATAHTGKIGELHERFLDHLRRHRASEEFVAVWSAREGGKGAWATDYA